MEQTILEEKGVERQPITAFTENAYLNYAMYVILDRALPHLGDGLKPVQRRIIYAMSELGLKSSAKFKKSARTVGDVLGKFHPHGDSACYEAMVLMAQSFSYRYPLIDGQGNWGSTDDPKSFAAMRYTESRLTAYADILLGELGTGTVKWLPNFDASLQEPALLPARLPNLLLNGTTGIAVGMATDIPPHNLNEVASACIYMLDNPFATVEDLIRFIPAPDYPTHAEIITSTDNLIKLYKQGQGSVRLRATYIQEGNNIVITALPYQVSGAKILEQIAKQMQLKKLPMLSDLRDESDHTTMTRLIIVSKSNLIDIDELMSHLFFTTDLEKTYRVNMNVVGIDGRPQVLPLNRFLHEWLVWRELMVRKRIENRLEKVIDRLHILEGLLIAFLHIEEVISVIRNEDEPKIMLMKKLQLSDLQATAILEIKLRQLAKLETIKINAEQKILDEERQTLQSLLKSEKKLKALIKKEIQADIKRFGNERYSPIATRVEAKGLSEVELISADPVTIVLSSKGWIRCAKGYDVNPMAMTYKSGDTYGLHDQGKTNQSCVIIDSTGRSYAILTNDLPSARGQGEPLTGRITLSTTGVNFVALCVADEKDCYLIASDAGYGFVVQFSDMVTKNKKGKVLLSLPNNAKVMKPVKLNDEKDFVVSVTNEGRMLVFPVAELPILSKGKGNKIIQISTVRASERIEFIVALATFSAGQVVTLFAGKRHLKFKSLDFKHYFAPRGKRGNKLPRGFQKVDRIEVS